MKRLLKFGGLPNVVLFSLPDKVLNAQLYKFGILHYKKRKIENVDKLPSITAANKFIMKQSNRLLKYAKDGNWDKFNFLAHKLLTSYAFQVQAYNSVYPQFMALKLSTVKFHIRFLRHIAHRAATNIDLKRVWIDKVAGDYGRPLGVPSVVWRVYLRMLLNIMEIAVKGQGKYTALQHGGRPGFGVGTCLKALIEKAPKADYILEFDIKGFFDNIRKDAMLNLIPEGYLRNILSKLICSTPNKYKFFPRATNTAMYKSWELKATSKYSLPEDFDARQAAFELHTGLKPEFSYRAHFKDLYWGLGQPDRGVPQGTAFGSFLSSTAVGHHLRNIPNLLMYCDDGMIFFNKGDANPLKRLALKLAEIGLELHPKKTNIRNRAYLETNGLKFLGTRLFIKDGMVNIRSETNKGTMRPLDALLPVKNKTVDFDMSRPSSWALHNEVQITNLENQIRKKGWKVNPLSNELIQLSIKFNFFNFLLSRAYDPNISEELMRAAILEGMERSLKRFKANPKSMSYKLLHMKMVDYTVDYKVWKSTKVDLFNLSTFAVSVLLNDKKFFIFDKTNALHKFERRTPCRSKA